MTSRFVELAEQYLVLRRSLGFALATQGRVVLDFARWADRAGDETPLTVDLAIAWATSSDRGGPENAGRRLSIVRGFARHCAGRDPATEIPSSGLLGPRARRKPPHIYSEAEIRDLLGAAARLQPVDGLRPLTYVTLFALLASTGLRVSEARHLTRQDIDLERRLITVREGKCRKSRLVPLHPSAIDPLQAYAVRRDRSRGIAKSNFFFRTETAPHLTLNAVEGVFLRLVRALGWSAKGRVRVPHIHDLRHSFVAHRMLRWYAEGVDVHRKIPVLSTYLGHGKVCSTYWYLSATPELLAVAGRRFEQLSGACDGGAS